MKILVTGAGGFVGVNLCGMLADAGHTVMAFSDLFPADPDLKILRRPGVEVVFGDVRGDLPMRGVDAVVHLAAFTSVPESIRCPVPCFDVNIKGTLNVLDLCIQNSVESVVVASSAAAADPQSPYGASKNAAETMCYAYSQTYGLRVTALRFSNLYGPHSAHKSSVIAQFCKAAATGEPLTVHGAGLQVRDFLHVADACRAILAAVEGNPGNGPYYVGAGHLTALRQVVDILCGIYDAEAEDGVPLVVEYTKQRGGEAERVNVGGLAETQDALGWEYEITLKRGIALTYDWFAGQTAKHQHGRAVA